MAHDRLILPDAARRRVRAAACIARAVALLGVAASADASGPPPASPLASAIDTRLGGATEAGPADEQVIVLGRRHRAAPMPDYGDARLPWEAARAIRDPGT